MRRPVIDETKPIWQTLLIFLIPLMLSNILQSASGTVNTIYLGRMIGVQALAAVSAFFPLQFLLFAFFIGVSNGSTVLIGQAYGARDTERIRAVAGTTISVAILSGIIIGILGSILTEPILRLVGTPSDIFPLTVGYARIIFLSLPVFFLYFGYTTFVRGVGDARTPFYFLILSTVLGIFLTPAFIRGWFGLPQFGVASAAVAATISTFIGFVGLLIVLAIRRDPLAFDGAMLRSMRISWPVLKAVIKIGLPTGLQVVIVSIAEIAVISFVNRFGSTATAAYGAVNQVVSYVQFPAISIGIASSIFGAQSIGARRFDRLRGIVRSGIALNYAIGGALIAIVYTFSWNVLGAFIKDPHVVTIAHELLVITLWSYVLFGNTAVLSGVMRSSGTVLWPTSISVFSILAIEVPIAYVLSQHTSLGLRGVWIAYPVAFAVGLALQTTYYKLVWRKMSMHAISF